MEANLKENQVAEDDEEEEYVFLDLTNACGQTDILANEPYVLSVNLYALFQPTVVFNAWNLFCWAAAKAGQGLDTENPILVIGNKLKLIGEYQETIGTCFVFSETVNTASIVQEQREPSDKDSSASKSNLDRVKAPTKQVKPKCSLQKILKFRLLSEDNNSRAETERSASTTK
ncbi:hypothetical protein ACLOJK_016045 [Asimina triloba]